MGYDNYILYCNPKRNTCYLTFEILILLFNGYKNIILGYGNDGQLGQPGRQDIPVPRVVEFGMPVKSLSCGIGHVAVVTNDG